ncbi:MULTISPECIES: protoporphyrinogen/coproporphyrinogen oxidase [Streptomyces]|uniref:protoporphyrinogen/coproporphyrinogen oxidase n=1 Tax=Streptomyces TaxID=1883 RepID=UPI00163C1C5F|nr:MULTISPECIES: FAD-dependent oxidoreductase [Streptomyces]MBC2878824.1 FAD-dependent oxidoreductase [Streptomyces sp. TYQ1024]UBI39260.1 FAD-dependent oxidoreductase [Streptomyces mobaraensis]UKW31841.1 FAD-dependent oxidoreductase [Streptomyces sp. TYQ1024]
METVTDIDVAVVGGGIAGLTTAYRLSRRGHRVEVFEAADEPGGRMRSSRVDGWTMDTGAETISPYGYPATWELIKELGLEQAGALHRIRHPVGLWRGGRTHPWVGHPRSLLAGAGMTARGRVQLLRMMLASATRSGRVDPDRPEDSGFGTRTLAQYGAAHGRELVDNLLAPVSSAAFGWLPERSSAAPMLAIMQGTHGIYRWQTYRDGQDTMARILAQHVKVHLSRTVTAVERDGRGARLAFADGTGLTARAAVVTLPSPEIPALRPDLEDGEREFLEASTFTTMIRVCVRLNRPLEPRRTAGQPRLYAFVMGPGEDSLLSGGTVEHNKCPARVPYGKGLVTLLISPRRAAEVYDLPDGQVLDRVLDEGERFIDGLRAAYAGHEVVRWRNGLPEAPPAALALRKAFVSRAPGPVEYAGDWIYLRPSSEAAIASSRRAASRVAAWLAR